MELRDQTALELGARIAARTLTARQVVEHFLARIERLDGELRAFLSVRGAAARAEADAVDRRLCAGEVLGPLAGVPIALKDNLCVAGAPTTCASKILADFMPLAEATVVERLRAAGLIILGKTNLDEFAMGSSTENSGRHPTANPWDRGRVPGGSSGGSAVAVAARLAPLALGSDTGGSIRQPAALCGVVGLKPTYGAVSRFGLVAYASSLDQIGPLARTVADAAALYQVIAGDDERDATSHGVDLSGLEQCMKRPLAGLRLGRVAEMNGEGIDPEVQGAVDAALQNLVAQGATVVDVRWPHVKESIPAYYVLACAEASSNLARYDGVRYGHRTSVGGDLATLYRKTRTEAFGAEVQRRILLGTFVLSAGYHDAYYVQAQKVRHLIRQDMERALDSCDVLVGPTTPSTAFRFGEKADPIEMYKADVCTVAVNLAGTGALSVPCGFSASGLPIGLQVIGRPWDEGALLQVGYALQQQTDHHTRQPTP